MCDKGVALGAEEQCFERSNKNAVCKPFGPDGKDCAGDQTATSENRDTYYDINGGVIFRSVNMSDVNMLNPESQVRKIYSK
jgi:hypothetical protein